MVLKDWKIKKKKTNIVLVAKREQRDHHQQGRAGQKGYRLRKAKRHARRAAKGCSQLHNPFVVLLGHELQAVELCV